MNMTLALMLAAMVAHIPFHQSYYNCWDYATDFQASLYMNNISSRIITGVVDCSSGLFDYDICKAFGGVHVWVEVNNTWIETTTGKEITDRDSYRMSYYSPPKYNQYKSGWLKIYG